MRNGLAALALVLGALGCHGGSGSADAGHADAGAVDGGSTDAGTREPTLVTVVTQARLANAFVTFAPTWIVGRDGAGPWSALPAADGGYALAVSNAAGRYTVAFLCSNGDMTVVYEGTTAEQTAITSQICAHPPVGQLSVNAQVTHLPGSDTKGLVLIGLRVALTLGESPAAFSVEPGTYNVLAMTGVGSGPYHWDQFVLSRNVTMNAANTYSYDFTNASNMDRASLTVTNLDAGDPTVRMTSTVLLDDGYSHDLAEYLPVTDVLLGIPASVLNPTEYNYVSAGQSNDQGSREVQRVVRSLTSLTLTAPEFFDGGSATATSTTPVVQFRFDWGGGSASDEMLLGIQQGDKALNEFITPGARQGTSYSLPDFTTAPGYQTAWGFHPGLATNWFIYGLGGTVDVSRRYALAFGLPGAEDGDELSTTILSGTETP